MRHLTCHLQEILPQISSLSRSQISSGTPMWNSTRWNQVLTSNLKPPLPNDTGCYVSSSHQARACTGQLTSSHMDFNCGFWQMFVQPITQFGSRGICCHLLGISENSTRFWLSVFIRWIGVFPKVELWPSVAVIYAWKWTQLPAVPAITPGSPCLCLPVKFVFRLEEYLWTDWIIYSNI